MVWRISSPALPKRRICSPKLAPLQPLHVKPMSRDPGGWKWLVWPKNGMWLWCWEFMIGVLARLVLIPSFIGPFLVWEISRFSTRQLPLALMVLCLQCITSITWLTRWALPRASASGVMESCTIPVHWESTMTMLRQLGLFQFLRFASAASWGFSIFFLLVSWSFMMFHGSSVTIAKDVTVFTSHFGVKFGIIICHEMNFASPLRSMISNGVRDIIFPTQWGGAYGGNFAATQSGFAVVHQVALSISLFMFEDVGKPWKTLVDRQFPSFSRHFPHNIFPIEIASTRHVGWGFSLGFRRWTSSRPMGCLEAPGFGLQIPRGLQNSSWPPHLGRRFVSAVIWWFFWCQTFWWFYDDFMTAKFRSWNINMNQLMTTWSYDSHMLDSASLQTRLVIKTAGGKHAWFSNTTMVWYYGPWQPCRSYSPTFDGTSAGVSNDFKDADVERRERTWNHWILAWALLSKHVFCCFPELNLFLSTLSSLSVLVVGQVGLFAVLTRVIEW